ncbi:MAG: endonuclease V [Thermoproteaceae archaeon]|jgi:deoxyribonuclease V|nr:endonuclease V [Thermoproteaceae archaeon]
MPLNLEAARRVQEALALRVRAVPLARVSTVAGLDVAYRDGLAFSAAVVVEIPGTRVVETAHSISKCAVPYVPTFLAFRELTPMLRAYMKLRQKPDVLLVDGHGIAHPRRLGIASHIGVVLNKPAIGVAKSRLYGVESGSAVLDPLTGEIIARIVTCGGRRRYVSIGSGVALDDAVRLVEMLCVGGDVLPLRLAHDAASRLKRARPAAFDQWGEAVAW